MAIRNVNGVPVSDHMVRRLGEIASEGRALSGCRNCSSLTLDRLIDAGLLMYGPRGYELTNDGATFLADVIGG